MRKLLLLILFSVLPVWSFAAAPSVSLAPEKVIQGEPVMVTVNNVSGAAAVKKITFVGATAGAFSYQGKPTALIGVDLNKTPGNYKVVVSFANGATVSKTIVVGARPKISAPLGIPAKLGGNTQASQTALVSSLAAENAALNSLKTFKRALWTEPFRFPISNPVVTDPYGYSRQTGAYSIAHKGTDFRAATGSPVAAMNRGIIRLARDFRTYGKTIVIDHGLGLFTIYMHLSKINFDEGELVKAGQIIGLSGETGYADKPHLHVSVWISKVSVDPMKFVALFKQ